MSDQADISSFLARVDEAIKASGKTPPWTWGFDGWDGYDCMSAAYTIYDKDKEVRLVVDTKNFASFDYQNPHAPLPEAEAMAKYLVACLNMKEILV